MVEYDIETRKFNSRNIRTKYNVNRTPVKLEAIDPRYAKTCQEIAHTHQNIIKQGDLEKITTIFESN